jgi:type III restriction enzyme
VASLRRRSSLVSPIPQPKKARGGAQSGLFAQREELGLEQEYNPTEVINGIRSAVESWRNLPDQQGCNS